MKLTLLLLFAFIAIGSAQQLRNSQVFLQNAEAESVSIGLSCNDRQTWKGITLDGHETQRFECDSRTAKVWAHINTDLEGESHKETEVELKNGSRYEAYFDQGSRKWDLRAIGTGAQRSLHEP